MEIDQALLSPDLRTFEAALAAFHGQGSRTIDDSIAAIDLLNKDESLGSLEIARRARLVLGQASLPEPDSEKLVAAASRWQPAVKLAIQRELTAQQRQRIYSPKSTLVPAEQSATAGVRPHLESGRLLLRGEVARLVSVPATTTQKEEDFKSVLLLGSAEAHESNIRFLATKDFSPIRVSSLTELDSFLGGAICGIVVDGSWWTVVPADQHESGLRRLLSFSNFIWLKIDEASLKKDVAAAFQTLCKECRFRDPLWNEVGFPMPSKLGAQDIQHLNAAASHLTAADRIRFHSSEITEGEATVLLGAIQKQQAGKYGLKPIQIQRVDTSVIPGGQSLAKIVIVKPQDISSPFVAKIATQDLLKDEMLRFNTFIEPWQGQLRPELYIHHGVAVIFFALIDGAEDQSKRAPTLEDRVIALGNKERNEHANNPAKIEDLQHAVTKAVEKLAALNRKAYFANGVQSLCWVQVQPLVQLKKNNIEFAIHEGKTLIDILEVAESARQQVEKLNSKATCHGDVHLRNVLVRLDREPLFIDFANSGPGHPAFDLVRLEAALLYAHFRMAESEDKMVECFHAMFTTDSSLEDLKRAHPKLLASKTSCLATHASIETRRAALEVLRAYGGNEKDYFSMKMIVACQSLTIQGFQEGAVRAGIRAISRILSKL
jgi:Phosphotransferase enzyme family